MSKNIFINLLKFCRENLLKNKIILIQIFWLGASATAQVRMVLMQTKGTATTGHDSYISVANTEIK